MLNIQIGRMPRRHSQGTSSICQLRSSRYRFTETSSIRGGRINSEIYIDSADGSASAALYEALLARRAKIEEIYGANLEFQELPNRRASRIVEYREGTVQDADRHEEFIDWFFDRGERLRRAINAVAEEI